MIVEASFWTPPGGGGLADAPSLDVEALREDSPGTFGRVHLNAAGASVMPRPVLRVLRQHLERESIEGGYDAGYVAEELVEDFYMALGRLLGVDPREIAFVDSGSRAWAMAFAALPFPPGSKVLLTDLEYQGNWVSARWLAEQRGWRLEVVQLSGEPAEDVGRVLARVDEGVRLVAAVHMPSNNGLIAPVEELGRALRERFPHVIYLVDACQSVGQLAIDAHAMRADLLVGTGRKYLRGPRGSAFIYAASRITHELRPCFLDTFSARPEGPLAPLPSARCFETWECNLAAKIGLGCAVRYLLALDLAMLSGRIRNLARALRARLKDVRGVRLFDLGDAERQSGLITFDLARHEPRAVWRELTARGFRLDTCQVQGTLLERRLPGVESAVRASVHYYTTESELDAFVAALTEMTGA